MGTAISGKVCAAQEKSVHKEQIPMGTGISGKFKENKKSERYIAHSGTFNPKRIPNATSQRHSVDQQSSRNVRNVNVTLHTQRDIQSKSKIRNITSQWHSVDQHSGILRGSTSLYYAIDVQEQK